MSNVSSELRNLDLINAAKQQYEKQQRTKVPPIVVVLPSKGLIYPESSILRQGSVEMRYMTAYDEDILTNATYIKTGVVFDKLLESLVVSPGVNVNDISATDRDGLIISARIHAYGNLYPVTVTDPKTQNSINRDVDLSKLKFKKFTLIPEPNGEFEYIFSDKGDTLKFKYLTMNESKNIDPDRSISKLLELSIMEINGNRDKNIIVDYIKFDMRALDAKKFRSYISDNLPGLDLTVQFEGEDGGTFDAMFQLSADLFWF